LISIPSANFTPRIGSVVAVEASPALLGGRGELEAHGQRGLVRKSEPDSGADGGRRPLIKAVDRHRFVGRSNASGTTVVSMPASIIFSMIAIGCPRTLSKMRPIYSLRIPSKRLLCGAFVLGSFLSIVMTGTVYGHYFVQLVPGLSMFAAATFIPRGKALASWKADGAKFAFGIALIALTIRRHRLVALIGLDDPAFCSAVNIVNLICEPSRANHFAFCQSARYGVLSANRSLQPFILCVRSSTSRLIRLSSASFFVSLPFSLSALLARANSPKVARTDLPIALARHELRIHEAAACTLSR